MYFDFSFTALLRTRILRHLTHIRNEKRSDMCTTMHKISNRYTSQDQHMRHYMALFNRCLEAVTSSTFLFFLLLGFQQ